MLNPHQLYFLQSYQQSLYSNLYLFQLLQTDREQWKNLKWEADEKLAAAEKLSVELQYTNSCMYSLAIIAVFIIWNCMADSAIYADNW